MAGEIAAKRYARALSEIGIESGSIDALKNELAKFREYSAKGYLDFLENPVFSAEEKIAVLNDIFTKEKSSKDFRRFFDLLVEEKRTGLLIEIYDCYVLLADVYSGQEKAKVISAVQLSEPQIESINKALSKMRGKKIFVVNEIDETVLGGIRVEVGSFVYDASVKGFLDKLKLMA